MNNLLRKKLIYNSKFTYFGRFYSNLKIYEINTPLYKSILTDEVLKLSNVFKKYNFELKIAGGAVRDLVLDKSPKDIDFATDALPDQMLDMFEKENIRILNLNGLKHGSLPIRIDDKVSFDITTLRIDVKTYGRHAEVEFTNDWHKDAIRRDLTINALFLDLEGKIYDYVDGMEDLKNRVVRFVGIPDKRVKEDYLRILRYFRFYSRICVDSKHHHNESLNAIKNNVQGLEKITGPRIGTELRIILSQKFSDSFMKMFYEIDLARYIGLPLNGNVDKYINVYQRCFKHNPNPMTLLRALLNTDEDIIRLNQRIALSNDEVYLLKAIGKYEHILEDYKNPNDLKNFLRRELSSSKSNFDRPVKKPELIELMKYLDRVDLIDMVKNIDIPKFELTHKDILKHVILDDKDNKNKTIEDYLSSNLLNMGNIKLNAILSDQKSKWIDSNFTLSKQDLLNTVDLKYLDNFIKKKKLKSKFLSIFSDCK